MRGMQCLELVGLGIKESLSAAAVDDTNAAAIAAGGNVGTPLATTATSVLSPTILAFDCALHMAEVWASGQC
jgi:hypothetical protein